MRIFISAGEASGDIHAAQLIAALRQLSPESEFTFLGGDLMAQAAGCDPLIHYRDMAYMGFSEVLRHLPQVLGNLDTARQALLAKRHDALILVDYPSFNLKLAKAAYKAGIPVYYYISPKVWAWKEGRVKKIKKYVRRVLSILPFEVEFFARRHNYAVDYVGNPSVAEVDARLEALPPVADFCKAHNLNPEQPILALLPGSRKGEIRNNLPIMAAVAANYPQYQTIVAGAPGIDPEFYNDYTAGKVIHGLTFDMLAYADAALVTSGTATLEAALIGTPQVVCYRANGSKLSYNLFKRILKVNYVSLPNLIANKQVVPEMLLHHCNPTEINQALKPLLSLTETRDVAACEANNYPTRTAMKEGYAEVRRRLTDKNSAQNAAQIILSDLNSR